MVLNQTVTTSHNVLAHLIGYVQNPWSTKGNYLATIVVPATPNSELARRMRKKCEKKNVRIKIQEKGGTALGNLLQKSNPTASGNCSKSDCYMDAQPEVGKMCHKSNVMYQWTCRICGENYVGETSRNF